MAKLLLKHGADPNVVNETGQSPFALSSSVEMREMLVKGQHKKLMTQVSVDEDYEEEEEARAIQLRHEPLSKADQLYEAESRFSDLSEDSDEELDGDGNEMIYEDILSFADNLDKKGSEPPAMVARGARPSMPTVADTADDLAKLPELTEQVMRVHLSQRYSEDKIYTNVGDILIAVNPFKRMPIFTKQICTQYHELAPGSSLSPHVFGVAERAYRALMREQCPQCCIICGESGSGKTETSKYLIRHLVSITANENTSKLCTKIKQANPLLEAFGNAQTKRNENSSRFGKYVELLFSEDGYLQGAKIHEYLLEKSRVIFQADGECNYHIFILLLAGLSPDELRNYGLESSGRHRYLKFTKDDVTNQHKQEMFTQMRSCFKLVGFTEQDIVQLITMLSAVINIGDIDFVATGNNDNAKVSNDTQLTKVAEMLQVDPGDLETALVSEVSITRGETIERMRSVAQAEDCRNGLAKAVYGRLFSWVVNSINQLIQPPHDSGPSFLEIGVLDIFGFENFARNSFEQMCINLANEQLQQYFNKYIFQMERDECLADGIQPLTVEPRDNERTVSLFLGPVGILDILDEESNFPRATDHTLATKLHSGPGKQSSDIYKTPKDHGPSFGVMHYAGMVTYDLNGMLDKNRDAFPKSFIYLLKSSASPLLKDMFQAHITRTGSIAPTLRQTRKRQVARNVSRRQSRIPDFKSAREFFRMVRTSTAKKDQKKAGHRPAAVTCKGTPTVAYHFKNSLLEMMGKMKAAAPHFIRCIKPNMGRRAGDFDPTFVNAQLNYTGIFETVRIRSEGYAMRITFEDFLTRYNIITLCGGSPSDSQATSSKEKCARLLKYCRLTDYQVGTTRVFFRYWHVDKLAEISQSLLERIITAQSVTRGWLQRRRLARQQEARRQQERQVGEFLGGISCCPTDVLQSLFECRDHDFNRREADCKTPWREREKEMEREGEGGECREEENEKGRETGRGKRRGSWEEEKEAGI
ncbi:Myosin-IIIb [Lamellibrachia satsuma]|nr:Myosin-IIIb [Lamellibrachia satsuma]